MKQTSQPSSEHKHRSFFDHLKPFILGGAAGCITVSIIMPIDTWKVRIQIKSEELGMAKGGHQVSPL